MNKKEAIKINSIFLELSNFGKTKFKYDMLKNIELLKPIVTPLASIEENVKKHLTKFEEDRQQLILKLGTKTDDGTVFIDINDADMVSKFNDGLKKLFEVHKDEVELYNTEMKDFQELLLEEVENQPEFVACSINSFPESDVTFEQLSLLREYKILVD